MGALRELDIALGRSTIQRILREQGLDPASKRRGTWEVFIRSHLGAIAAVDFFTVEVLTAVGLVRKHVLFVIEVASRCVHIAGIVGEPNGAWVERRAHELVDPATGSLRRSRYLIHDRSKVFTEAFRATLAAAGITCLRIPPMSPNLNAYAERFVRSIRSELLDRVVILGEGHLRILLKEYLEHYHHERTHQGIGNRVPIKLPANDEPPSASIHCKRRLGGLLNYYHRR
jgi:putative transposase